MDYLSGLWQEIAARPDGPMAFRFYLQPAMSMIYAVISGRKDAREHRPPYFWAMFTDPAHRVELMRDGWKSVRDVFLLAIAMDLIYQIIVLKGLRPVQGLVISVVLAIVPYLLVRGPVNRLARLFGSEAPPAESRQAKLSRPTTSRGPTTRTQTVTQFRCFLRQAGETLNKSL